MILACMGTWIYATKLVKPFNVFANHPKDLLMFFFPIPAAPLFCTTRFLVPRLPAALILRRTHVLRRGRSASSIPDICCHRGFWMTPLSRVSSTPQPTALQRSISTSRRTCSTRFSRNSSTRACGRQTPETPPTRPLPELLCSTRRCRASLYRLPLYRGCFRSPEVSYATTALRRPPDVKTRRVPSWMGGSFLSKPS